MDILDFLPQNWAALGATPWVFVSLVVLSFLVALLVVRWRYEGIVQTRGEQLEALQDRLNAKDEQLDAKDKQLAHYRERLRLTPATGTAYSRLSNAELQQRALQLVANILSFLVERDCESTSTLFRRWHSRYQELSEEERQQAWVAETNAMMQQSLQTNAEYDSRFKVESILLRDELLSRLPPYAENEREYSTYEHPTNPIGMGMVADDLERLAKSLPREEGK